MTDNIILLCVLVILSIMNLLLSLIINFRRCKQEIKDWEAIHHLNDKFHRK
jgi:uncharacterized membrane protein